MTSRIKTVVALAGIALFSALPLMRQTRPAPLPDNRVREVNAAKYSEVVRPVQGKIVVVAGAGSSVSVLPGDDGLLIVDDQYRQMSDKLLAALKTISDKPVRFVINTHRHPDPIGGNEALAKLGAVIFAAQRSGPAAAPLPPTAYPIMTFKDPIT